MTPKEIVAYLDEYIIGQRDAKKAIAVALRNRWRRMQLQKNEQEEIVPKNILMIGPTGVGKTEIARRMAKMMNLPFVKVEASKYTEVGFVGRDVESMVRDLALNALTMVKDEHKEKNEEAIAGYVLEKIATKLLPPLPKGATTEKEEEYKKSLDKMKARILSGEADHLIIEVEVPKKTLEAVDGNLPPDMAKMQESFVKIFSLVDKGDVKKEVSVKEAKEILKAEASEKLLDMEAIKAEALERAKSGIIFIDEIDKIAVSSGSNGRSDPSKEGVQRDLLPIVEGSNVSTKYGTVPTDHILFIAAGAFHLSKPSDLIPELQGRFPIRVELDTLDEETMYAILTKTKNSLLRQYEALMKTENIQLSFDEASVRAMARYAIEANKKLEDIGARRLHTVIEQVVEELSFACDEYVNQSVVITQDMVDKKLEKVVGDTDLTRYIL